MTGWKKYVLPIILLLIFIAIMISGKYIKKPFGKNDDVMAYIDRLKEQIAMENWHDVQKTMDKLYTAWDKVKFRTQFCMEKSKIQMFEEYLSHLEGTIKVEDSKLALIDLEVLTKTWDTLEE